MKQPVGFFDSGIGGISLLPSFEAILPHESICYVADHAYSPYGEKPHAMVLERARKITEKLITLNCKLIVLACNTATTQIIDQLRKEYTIPFVGIEPALKPAAFTSKTGKIGVLATKGTLESELFHKNIGKYGNGVDIIKQIGKGLVECVEAGEIKNTSTRNLLESLLNPMVSEGIDTLVLGCTHYPLLLPLIEQILPQHVNIIDNSQAVANQIKYLLEKENKLVSKESERKIQFYSTERENNLHLFTKTAVEYLHL